MVMQMAASVGLKLRGVTGAMASFIGLGLPAFLLMMAFSVLYSYNTSLPRSLGVMRALRMFTLS